MAGGVFKPGDFPPLPPPSKNHLIKPATSIATNKITPSFGTRPSVNFDSEQKTGPTKAAPPPITKDKVRDSGSDKHGVNRLARGQEIPLRSKDANTAGLSGIISNTCASHGTETSNNEIRVLEASGQNQTAKQRSNLAKNYLDRLNMDFVEGKPHLSIDVSAKSQLVANIKHIVVAKFSQFRPRFQDFKNFLLSMDFVSEYKIANFDSKHVFLTFECFEDFVRLWMQKSKVIKGNTVRFFQWDGDFHPSIETPIAPIWVHLPKLPLYLYDEEVIMTIASLFGKLLYIDSANLRMEKVGCLSFCVAKDARIKGHDELVVEFVDKGVQVGKIYQQVYYGAVPDYCAHCFHLGHGMEACKTLSKTRRGKQVLENELSIKIPVKSAYDERHKTPATGLAQAEGSNCVNEARNNYTVCGSGSSKIEQSVQASVPVSAEIAPTSGSSAQEIKEIHSESLPETNQSSAAERTKEGISLQTVSVPQTPNEAMNILHNFVVNCVSGNNTLDESSAQTNVLTEKRTGGNVKGTSEDRNENDRSKEKLQAHNHATMPTVTPNNRPVSGLTTETIKQGHQELQNGKTVSDLKTNLKGTEQTWYETAEKNLPMDFSIPPFNYDDVLVEEVEETSEQGDDAEVDRKDGDNSEVADFSSESSDTPSQKLEYFEEVSAELNNTKSSRIRWKKNGLKDDGKWILSEEEEEDRNTTIFTVDRIMVDREDGRHFRLSKLIDTKAQLLCQKSVSPVGRTAKNLKNLKTKVEAIQILDGSAKLLSLEEYDEKIQAQDARLNQHQNEQWITPKRRGRPPKRQSNPSPGNRKPPQSKSPEPRKRGRPKKRC